MLIVIVSFLPNSAFLTKANIVENIIFFNFLFVCKITNPAFAENITIFHFVYFSCCN